jgi:glycosyltransferase involved in cell wall biosynthesis
VFYSDGYCVGGAETVLATLVEALGDRVRATVLATEPEVVRYMRSRLPGVEVRALPAVAGKRDVAGIRAHVRAVRALRPQILHVNAGHPWAGQYGIVAGLLAPGTRVVSMEHSVMPTDRGGQRWLRSRLNTRIDVRVAVSREAARGIERVTAARTGSLEVIYNGVRDVAVTPCQRFFAGPTVGFTGRFTREKAVDVLLAAVARLPGVGVVLVGDGELLLAARRFAGELGLLDRVVFTGFRDDVPRILPTFDVLALPSTREGFGLSIVEAMLAGVPVVSTTVGGIPEVVIDGETGLLVAPRDAEALARALARLLSDAALAQRLREAGRCRARQRFSAEAMAAAFLELYGRVMARGWPTPSA